MKISSELLKKLGKILLTILLLVVISVICTLILSAFKIVYFDDGIKLNQELFLSFANSWYGALLIILIQIVITSLLSFVPGASMAFIILLQTLYDNPVTAFIIAFSGVMLTSFMLYVLGRFGGYALCKKLLGEEDCEKASELLNVRGLIYFPLMMMFPVFPDDALVMVAGTLKMDLKWFVPSIVLGRGIGVVTIVFGLSIVPFDKFTSIWHWVIFIALCALLIVAVFYFANKFNKYMENKRKKDN
jgi:uncharacterized membrane protein YdjX (TVP38/TMEM64 family)